MSKDTTGGNLGDYPNEKYRQFFEKFAEIETLDVTQWKPVHILAYFCKKYKDQYGVGYTFKFNSPSPPKCFEVFQVKRLAMLLSANPTILKEYIDWVYDTKVPETKRRFTSISFMAKEEVVQWYKMNILLKDKKDIHVSRSTVLPSRFKDPFTAINVQVSSYGDLAFLVQMDQSSEMKQAFDQAVAAGLDLDILKRIV